MWIIVQPYKIFHSKYWTYVSYRSCLRPILMLLLQMSKNTDLYNGI